MLRLCRFSEIPDGEARGFAIEGPSLAQRLVVIRRGDAAHGYVNSCPHILSRLDHAPGDFLIEDDAHIHCDSHGALFRIEDGVCVAGPCLGAALTPAPVLVRDGDLYLNRSGVQLVDEISKLLSDLR